jgi:DNA-binding response OmpR family regulator
MKARILIAEDDTSIRLGLLATLESEGYQVIAANDGAQALRLFPQNKYDLIILDVMMPQKSGYDVCRQIRADDPEIPILFLTAKGEEIDKVVGLKMGADDYMSKPFGIHELLARVEALLRRSRLGRKNNGQDETPASALPAVFHFGEAEIDRHQYTATLGSATVSLTARELKLLETLAVHPGEVITRDQLLNAVWGVDYYGTTRTLDQHIAQLRKKIERHPDNPQTIITVHGVGYRYKTADNPRG